MTWLKILFPIHQTFIRAILMLTCMMFLDTAGHAQVSATSQLNISTALVLGSQDNLLRFSIHGLTVVESQGAASEFSIGGDFDLFLSKYGAKTKGHALRLEGYFIAGGSSGSTTKPYYSGELTSLSPPSEGVLDHIIYGGGIGMQKNILFGKLKPLSNDQGLVLIRSNIKGNPLILRFKNDFRAGFMRGSGTDQGETGSFHLSYSFMDEYEQLHLIGLNLSLFTPVPDYSQNPTHQTNSKDSLRPVLQVRAPFKGLFHGNLYSQYRFQSDHFSQNIGLGIDSQKLGGTLQNALHDSFGLYPRFPWDMEAKNKLYFQSITGFHDGL